MKEITAEELLEKERKKEVILVHCNGEPVLSIDKHRDGVFIYGRWSSDIDEPVDDTEVSSIVSEALNWSHIAPNEKFMLHPSVGVIFFPSDEWWEPHYNKREKEKGIFFSCKGR